VRWHEEQPADADDDGDDDDGGSDGSQRFEVMLSRYWSNVTQMSLQCALTVCSKASKSDHHIPPVRMIHTVLAPCGPGAIPPIPLLPRLLLYLLYSSLFTILW